MALGKRLQSQGDSHLKQVQEKRTHRKGLQKRQNAESWKCCIDRGEARQRILEFRMLRAASVDSLDPLVDSGCNGFMLRDKVLSKDLDESFSDDVAM